MLAKIGAAVAAERRRQGLGAEDLGIDAALLQRLEAGVAGITVLQLEDVARALQLDPLALRRGLVVAMPQASVFLRHHPIQDFDATDGAVLDQAVEHARARTNLATLLGIDVGLFPARTFLPQPVAGAHAAAPAHQGYQLARETRTRLGLGLEPAKDLRELTESRLGILVLVRRLQTMGASAVATKAGDAAAIVLASVGSGAMTRVCLAHEICHVLFDPPESGVHVVIDFATDRRTQQLEQRARAFAAEFLLPKDGLQEHYGPPTAIRGVDAALALVAAARDDFGATWQVTANQLCNQGFVDMSLREWLENQQTVPPPKTNWSAPLPQQDAPSILLGTLLRTAHDRGLVTDAEVRELLGMDPRHALPWDPR